jgi:hypothetical protein
MRNGDELLTNHAQARVKDRGIPEIARHLLFEFGLRERAGGGAERYSFDKKTWREVQRFFGHWPLKRMDQLKRTYMIVADGGAVVTVAYRKG